MCFNCGYHWDRLLLWLSTLRRLDLSTRVHRAGKLTLYNEFITCSHQVKTSMFSNTIAKEKVHPCRGQPKFTPTQGGCIFSAWSNQPIEFPRGFGPLKSFGCTLFLLFINAMLRKLIILSNHFKVDCFRVFEVCGSPCDLIHIEVTYHGISCSGFVYITTSFDN